SVGDGIPDSWRALYFGGNGKITNSQSCASCDPDGDGMSNLPEYLADTDPTDASSVLQIVSVATSGPDSLIRFTTVTNKFYRVDRAAAVDGPTIWTTVTNN